MTKHMSQKQRNEFNKIFLQKEKELRESKYKRRVSQQVQRQRRWKQRREERDAAIINRQRAKPLYSWGSSDRSLPLPTVSYFGGDPGSGGPARASAVQVPSAAPSAVRRAPALSGSGGRPATTTSSSSRPPSPPPWRKKCNKFLQNRKVVDRFKASEDPAVAAARRRHELVTAEFHSRDRTFQDVLDACWPMSGATAGGGGGGGGGEDGGAVDEAAAALKRLRPRGYTAAARGGGSARRLFTAQRGGGVGGDGGGRGGGAANDEGDPSWSVDDAVNSHGYTLLGQAVVDKNHFAVRFLVGAKASIGQHDANGLTALHVAALENDLDSTKLLLSLHADPSRLAFGVCAGKTAVGAAVAAGSGTVAAHLQVLQIQLAKVPRSYAQRYQKMNRFVPIEVSGREAARALNVEAGLFAAEPKPPRCRSFPGTDKFFEAQERERQRRRLLSSNYRFNRRVGFLEEVEKMQRDRLKQVKAALAQPVDDPADDAVL